MRQSWQQNTFVARRMVIDVRQNHRVVQQNILAIR